MSAWWQQVRRRCRPGWTRRQGWQPSTELCDAQAALTQAQARLAVLRSAPPPVTARQRDAAAADAPPAPR